MDFYRFFSDNRVCHYIQIVSVGDNSDEMTNPALVLNVNLCFDGDIF